MSFSRLFAKIPATAVLAIAILILNLIFEPAHLYLDIPKVQSGEIWRAVSGHLAHTDFSHLAWNLIAFVLIGGFIERRSPSLLLSGIICGMLAVNAWLLSPFATISMYCGLSGLINTLFVIALYLASRDYASSWVSCIIALYLIKLALEYWFPALLPSTSIWPSYPPAHYAGAGAGFFAAFIYHLLYPPLRPNAAEKQ